MSRLPKFLLGVQTATKTCTGTVLDGFVVKWLGNGSIDVTVLVPKTLLGIASNGRPQTYWDITGKENGRKHRRPRRITPKRRKTALGMRSDRLPRPRLPVSGG